MHRVRQRHTRYGLDILNVGNRVVRICRVDRFALSCQSFATTGAHRLGVRQIAGGVETLERRVMGFSLGAQRLTVISPSQKVPHLMRGCQSSRSGYVILIILVEKVGIVISAVAQHSSGVE